ncbi:hypothetical protein Tco_0582681 [Tanacetum coccineum]
MRKRDRKRNFKTREKENARREKKFKGLVNVRSERREIPHSQKGINTMGMVRGKGYRKRPYEKIKQWMDNEISFPSVPRNLGPNTRAKPRESRVPLLRFSGSEGKEEPIGAPEENRPPNKLRMTKVIKGEFEKHEDLNDEDVSLACGTSLEVFNKEFNRMSGMDNDLFTYEVEVANIPCDSNKDDDSEQRVSHEVDDDMGYDPSDVAFTEWLGSNFFNYKTMDHYTKKALWIYWIRGDDEVELTDEEFSDNEDEVAETYLLRKLRDSRLMKNIRMIGSMNGTEMYHGLMRNHGLTLEFGLNPHKCKPFNYKTGCLEWPTCSWKNDGYCNGGNLLGAYIVGNSLHYQDYEWYEALMDCELKEQALRNKAIMEGLISDDESCGDGWRRWESHEITYHDHDEIAYKNETHDERQEFYETHELQVCNMRRFEMIKYSFGQDEEYVAVKEDEYDDLEKTSDDACRAYPEIFRMMDEGWMVTRAE